MRPTILCLTLLAVLVPAPNAHPVTLSQPYLQFFTFSYVLAPYCCNIGSVRMVYQTIVGPDPAPAWYGNYIKSEFYGDVFYCLPFRIREKNYQIGLGGYTATDSIVDSSVSCPIEAKSGMFSSAGGFGQLPYAYEWTFSYCERPCAGPGCGWP